MTRNIIKKSCSVQDPGCRVALFYSPSPSYYPSYLNFPEGLNYNGNTYNTLQPMDGSNTDTSTMDATSSSPLSAGAVAGILGAVALVVMVIFFFLMRMAVNAILKASGSNYTGRQATVSELSHSHSQQQANENSNGRATAAAIAIGKKIVEMLPIFEYHGRSSIIDSISNVNIVININNNVTVADNHVTINLPAANAGSNIQSNTELISANYAQSNINLNVTNKSESDGDCNMAHRQSMASVISESEDMCSVCLSGFKEKDMVRILPRCRHIFHVACIDQWIIQSLNASCPMCRVSIAIQDGSFINESSNP